MHALAAISTSWITTNRRPRQRRIARRRATKEVIWCQRSWRSLRGVVLLGVAQIAYHSEGCGFQSPLPTAAGSAATAWANRAGRRWSLPRRVVRRPTQSLRRPQRLMQSCYRRHRHHRRGRKVLARPVVHRLFSWPLFLIMLATRIQVFVAPDVFGARANVSAFGPVVMAWIHFAVGPASARLCQWLQPTCARQHSREANSVKLEIIPNAATSLRPRAQHFRACRWRLLATLLKGSFGICFST